jgi:hypothetical protein
LPKTTTAKDFAIYFGAPEWQAHLGGDFHGPEFENGISWNWAGSDRCWCVLPSLEQRDYQLRLEAAPHSPFQSKLYELILRSGNNQCIRRVIPVSEPTMRGAMQLNLEALRESGAVTSGGILPLQYEWRVLPDPIVDVYCNDLPVAELAFELHSDLQLRDFVLRRQLIRERNVLYFVPNFAVSTVELGSGQDARQLSLRFFRMLISAI